MPRILYLDASSGVSGDMFVGALLDLGADFGRVCADVAALGAEGLEVRARKVVKGGVAATKFDVFDALAGRPADEGDDQHRFHPHRRLREIRRLLEGGGLPPEVAADALSVFERLAVAEAEVHGSSPEDVHFHEVGALDAVADVVAAASAFRQLGPDEAWCSPVHVGSGTVRCAHGLLAVPVPATAELLRGVPTYSDGVRGELATPTGAALIRHFCARFAASPPAFLAEPARGCGAGTKELERPNVLRALLGRVE